MDFRATSFPKEAEDDVAALLRQTPVFSLLSPAHLAHVSKNTRKRHLWKGEMLFQEGDALKGVFVVVTGRVKLAMQSPNGDEKVVDVLGPLQTFGEAAMLLDRPYPLTAESLSDGLVLSVARNAVISLMESDVSFSQRMVAVLSNQILCLLTVLESCSLRSGIQRVIDYLLQHCPKEHGGAALEISLPAPKQVIASQLNLTPETLSRLFRDLAEAKLIHMRGREVKIRDVSRLREFNA